MSAPRWALSLFLIFHLASIGLASLPPGARPNLVGSPRHPTDDSIAGLFTPAVDSVAKVTAGVTAALLRTTRPIRRWTDLYVATMGLGQTWSMFSSPWTENRYARLRYYVASPHSSKSQNASPTWTATEMVFPALRAGERVNPVRAYRSFAWDKAFISSMEAVVRERSTEELPPALAPVVRYFTRRYQRTHLVPGERIVRTEIWLGRSPVRQRGSVGDPPSRDARNVALTESYAGSLEEAVWGGRYPPRNATEKQEDIVWQLEFLEE